MRVSAQQQDKKIPATWRVSFFQREAFVQDQGSSQTPYYNLHKSFCSLKSEGLELLIRSMDRILYSFVGYNCSFINRLPLVAIYIPQCDKVTVWVLTDSSTWKHQSSSHGFFYFCAIVCICDCNYRFL